MGYVRNTYGCHCFYGDSSFKRYNRAHLGGDTVIFNYNSGNTYNACCGGGFGGGSWFSNLMAGFGMGLGGYLGNMFGGFGMGMGNMFGGFGFPSWGNFGNWGLGGASSTSGVSDTPSTKKAVDDKDYTKLNDLHAEANKLIKDIQDGKIADPAKAIDDLNKKLDDYKKLDKKQTAENDEQIENIKKQLADAKAGLNKSAPAQIKPVVQEVALKHDYGNNGYSNYDPKDGALNNGDVIRAHDESGATKDTVRYDDNAESTITKSSDGNHPQTIVIHDKKDITYTYTETKDGEYLYESDKDHQIYVLQKRSDGKYDLMQYSHHKGYGTKDWS